MSLFAHKNTNVRVIAENDSDVAALRNVIELAIQKWCEFPEVQMRGNPGIKRGGFIGADITAIERTLKEIGAAVGLEGINLLPNLDCCAPALDPLYRSTPATDAAAGATPAKEAEAPDEKAAAARAAQQHLMEALDGLFLRAAVSQIFGARKPAREKAAA